MVLILQIGDQSISTYKPSSKSISSSLSAHIYKVETLWLNIGTNHPCVHG
jgi:hypothetical protein